METALLGGLLEVLLLNIVLSGDNAVVIGLAARSLDGTQRQRAIAAGGGLAVALRLALTVPAEALLHLALLRLSGGLLLSWIAYRLLTGEGETVEHEGGATVISAIRLIVLADLTMSLDNVLAVAAVANRSSHSFLILAIGLGLSIPIVLLGGGLVATLMRRLPWLVWIGAAVLTYTASELLLDDRVVQRLATPSAPVRIAVGAIWSVLVLAAGWWTLRLRHTPESVESGTSDG